MCRELGRELGRVLGRAGSTTPPTALVGGAEVGRELAGAAAPTSARMRGAEVGREANQAPGRPQDGLGIAAQGARTRFSVAPIVLCLSRHKWAEVGRGAGFVRELSRYIERDGCV